MTQKNKAHKNNKTQKNKKKTKKALKVKLSKVTILAGFVTGVLVCLC